MKLKEFLRGHGFLQHLACFLLYVVTGVTTALLWEAFEDSSDWVIVGMSMLGVPVISWIFYLIYCDVTAVGRWLWRLIVPEKWRRAIDEFFAPEVVVRMGDDVIVRKSHAPFLRRNGVLTPVTIAQARALADSHRSRQAEANRSKPMKADNAPEMEIFRMWEDAVVWKDGGLYYRKRGEYEPIAVERARELERGYHFYQMTQDIHRGGAPDEVARRSRGFDQNGNYVGEYAVDRFWVKRFGYVPDDPKGITVTRCMRCGKKLDEPVKAKSDSYIRCRDCTGEQGNAPVAAQNPVKTAKCARCERSVNQDEITVREGAAYCASCANRLKIRPKAAGEPEKPIEMRCEGGGKRLKAGESVSRGGAHHCRKCGDLPDKSQDQPVLETPHWSIVWNDGKLYKYARYGGYRRISLYRARELEREHMLGMRRSCIERGLMSEEKANETYRIKDGKYAGPYAVDALSDGRSGTTVFSAATDTVIWKDGMLYSLMGSGECKPISPDEVRKIEFDYWNDMAAQAWRASEMKLFEEAQGRIKETEDGFRLKAYAVDEFMKRKAEAVCIRCGSVHCAALRPCLRRTLAARAAEVR